jgi:hypothetical protein
MAGRHDAGRDSRLDNPSPAAYNITPAFANDAHKFTLHQRTVTQGDDTISPGPAAYQPNFEAMHPRGPSATMHIRPEAHALEITPGPGEYPVARDLGGTKSTFHIRPQVATSSSTPGPGQYSPANRILGDAPKFTMKGRPELQAQRLDAPYQTIPSSVGDGPKISMASRHAEKGPTETPGPGYMPPSLGADGRKSSMAGRHDAGRDSRLDNPSPAAYNITPAFANDAHKFTLHQRTGGQNDQSVSPGPGQYQPNIDAMLPKAPAPTMHIRPQNRTVEITPGPGQYPVARGLGGTKSTFHIRPQVATSSSTPGPGQYSPGNKILGDAPKFTMKGRPELQAQRLDAPYQTIPSSVGAGPKISMVSRHAEKGPTETPGPVYMPPSLGADGRKSSMAGRHDAGRDSRLDNPSPAAYNITPTFANDAHKFTLHQRTGGQNDQSVSPGPGQYQPNIDAMLPKAPAPTMHIRPPLKGPEETPGYLDLGSTLRHGGITIGRRENLDLIPV